MPVSRTSATRPVPRVRYQSACPDIAATPPLRGRRDPRPRMSSSAGHPPTVTTSPVRRTSRAGSPSLRPARLGADAPSRMAAVDAVLAPAQVAAATVTVRQTTAAGRPVRGSIRWCSSSPPRCQRRRTMLDVANPPAVDDDGRSRSVGGRVVLVGQPHDPAAERWSGHRDVTAEADEHAGASAGRPRPPRRGRRTRPWPSLPGRARRLPAP